MIYRNMTCCRLQQTEYQTKQGGFSRTCLAHYSCFAAWCKIMTETLQHLSAVGSVTKTHIFKRHSPRHCGWHFRHDIHLSLKNFLTFHLFKTVYACRGMNERRQGIDEREHRALYHRHQLQERGHHSKGDGSGAQSPGSPNKSQQIAYAERAAKHETADNGKAGAADVMAVLARLQFAQLLSHPTLALQ